MHTGAVAFCVGLRSVLCVRKAGSAKWQFPHLQAAEADEKSAATAVQQLTGLDVSASFTADYVEVGGPPHITHSDINCQSSL